MPSELHRLSHGGETNLWAELTDNATLDSKSWPRATAAAETLWVSPGKMDEQMTRRLAEFKERLVPQGLEAVMVQMKGSLRSIHGSSM